MWGKTTKNSGDDFIIHCPQSVPRLVGPTVL